MTSTIPVMSDRYSRRRRPRRLSRRRRARVLADGVADEFLAADTSAVYWPHVYWRGLVTTPDERTHARHLADALLGRGRRDVGHALALYLGKAREVAGEVGHRSHMHVAAERLARSLN